MSSILLPKWTGNVDQTLDDLAAFPQVISVDDDDDDDRGNF
jgi:hypothetical protein